MLRPGPFGRGGATDKFQRAAVLNAVADAIEDGAELLAEIETLDNGKPIRETRAFDIAFSAEYFLISQGAC